MSLLVEHLKMALEVYELHPKVFEDPDVVKCFQRKPPLMFMGKKFAPHEAQLILAMIEKELVNV